MAKPVAILGNGGHAQVIKEALEAMGREVCGCFHFGPGVYNTGISADDAVAVGVGRRKARRDAVALYAAAQWVTVIHPSATVSPSAQIGEGAQIMAGAIIQANAVIGRHVIVNTGAQVDHGCVIGDFAHICPGAVLCADVTVDEGAMVEPGYIIRRGSVVPRTERGEFIVVGPTKSFA